MRERERECVSVVTLVRIAATLPDMMLHTHTEEHIIIQLCTHKLLISFDMNNFEQDKNPR